MKLYKEIDIDILKEQTRIQAPGVFNKQERTFLLKLLFMFERGEFKKCAELIRSVDRSRYSYDYIPVAIWDVLYDHGCGSSYALAVETPNIQLKPCE
jgi:hypothetical protein